jgi:hypothetical protein
VQGDVDHDHYAQRYEHEEAPCIEDVLESHDRREEEPGEHDGSEENRTGPRYRRRHLGEQEQSQ